jgi:redox-sensitive bicupin YhaK (pirin superfamily)
LGGIFLKKEYEGGRVIYIRKSEERGSTQLNWLDSKHTFSFGHYYDSNYMGFGPLCVINEDKVASNTGFGQHPHQDMEIISYVLKGGLEHKDSLGNGSIIVPGDVQRMSAGIGITYSEFNLLTDETVHFLQIWVIPNQRGISPSYEHKSFTQKYQLGQLALIASYDGREDSVMIHQDAEIYVLHLDLDQTFQYLLKSERMAWVQIAEGVLTLNNKVLNQGDGAAVVQENTLEFIGKDKAEILIFDLHEEYN